MQSKLSDAVDELRNALETYKFNESALFYINLYGMNFVTGELNMQKLLKIQL